MGNGRIHVRTLLASLLLLSGCRLAQDVVNIPGNAVSTAKTPEDIMELQGRLLRFSDEYLSGVIFAMEHLRTAKEPLEPRKLLQWKIGFGSATTTIVSGANPRAGVLDMTVFVSLTRIIIEDYWQPKVFGEAGLPLVEACRNAEETIWRLNASVLRPEEQQQLRIDILDWLKTHPQPESPLSVRAVDFAAEVSSKPGKDGKKKDGVLNILQLDPLQGLDPAVREITQTRLLAERGLFVAQRMATMLRWQTELFGINMLEAPEIKQLVADTTRVSKSVERLTVMVEKFPETFAKEREALLKSIESQEQALKPMIHEVGLTLDSGTRLAESLNATVKSVDSLLKRLEGPPSDKPKPESPPFRIEDYTKTAMQLEATVKQVTELVTTVDKLLAAGHVENIAKQVDPAVKRAEAGGKELMDHAFWKAAILVFVIFAAALLYRLIASRIKPAHAPVTAPPSKTGP